MTKYDGTQWHDEETATVFNVSDEVRKTREEIWKRQTRREKKSIKRVEDMLQAEGFPIIRTTKPSTNTEKEKSI